MKRKFIDKLKPSLEGKVLILKGWVANAKDMNKVKFLSLRDKTGSVQCIGNAEKTDAKTFAMMGTITPESVVEVKGELKVSKQAKQGFEILVHKIKLISESDKPLPIDTSSKSQTNIDKRIDYRFLDMRREEIAAIFKVRSNIVAAITEFFEKNGFVNINTPKLTAMGVESGAEMFEVNYFGKKAYLSQSPQIYKQMMVVSGLERVYEIGPVYRAEKSHTNRHLTEFVGVDFEMGFIKNENDIMDVIEKMFIDIIKYVKKTAEKELKILNVDLLVPQNIPRLTMPDVKMMLAKKGKNLPEDVDLDAEAENLLGEIVKSEYSSEFVFVTRYPVSVRPFYHMRDKNNKNQTLSFDLIWKGVEVATGAQREHRYKILKKQASEKGVDLDQMKSYADIFRYGCPPHGGVGFGLDRISQRMLNLNNVREAVLLPRDPERLTP